LPFSRPSPFPPYLSCWLRLTSCHRQPLTSVTTTPTFYYKNYSSVTLQLPGIPRTPPPQLHSRPLQHLQPRFSLHAIHLHIGAQAICLQVRLSALDGKRDDGELRGVARHRHVNGHPRYSRHGGRSGDLQPAIRSRENGVLRFQQGGRRYHIGSTAVECTRLPPSGSQTDSILLV